MQTLHKLLSALLVAFFATFTGVAGAAPAQPQALTGVDSGTVQQTPAPPDCKKDPRDPRCGK